MNRIDPTYHVREAVRKGVISVLEEYRQENSNFPFERCQDYVDRKWAEIFIAEGGIASVEWLINVYGKKRIALYEVENGMADLPFVHAALSREDGDKYKVLKLIIDAGADPSARGRCNYTPMHQAAVDNDCEALIILKNAGASFFERTEIDDDFTPREEAESLCGNNDAIKLLKKWEGS